MIQSLSRCVHMILVGEGVSVSSLPQKNYNKFTSPLPLGNFSWRLKQSKKNSPLALWKKAPNHSLSEIIYLINKCLIHWNTLKSFVYNNKTDKISIHTLRGTLLFVLIFRYICLCLNLCYLGWLSIEMSYLHIALHCI